MKFLWKKLTFLIEFFNFEKIHCSGGSVDDASRDSAMDSDSSSEVGVTPNVSSKAPSQRPVFKPKIDPAMEAELKAAKDREQIPLDERIVRFKELLAEKDVSWSTLIFSLFFSKIFPIFFIQVSAYSTWEKELHKIVFDPRYLLLTSKDRRDVFDDFTKEKAEKEREEKKKKIAEIREAFKSLLSEANLTSKYVSFPEFLFSFDSVQG
jgi:transcription elongation regulator 1